MWAIKSGSRHTFSRFGLSFLIQCFIITLNVVTSTSLNIRQLRTVDDLLRSDIFQNIEKSFAKFRNESDLRNTEAVYKSYKDLIETDLFVFERENSVYMKSPFPTLDQFYRLNGMQNRIEKTNELVKEIHETVTNSLNSETFDRGSATKEDLYNMYSNAKELSDSIFKVMVNESAQPVPLYTQIGSPKV